MKDKEFDAKLIAYLLGKEELFDEVVDELAEKIKRIAAIGPLPLDKTEFCLRDAVLAEAAPFIKIEQQPYNMRMTATLLLAEREDV